LLLHAAEIKPGNALAGEKKWQTQDSRMQQSEETISDWAWKV
jgi:hypothetical protein